MRSPRAKCLLLALLPACLALLSSCRDRAASAASPDPVPPAPLAALASPAEAFVTWIGALQRDDLDTAMGCLYLPLTNQVETVRKSLGPHATKIRMDKWDVKVVATGEQGRFAAIIYTTGPDKTDYDPVLAIRQPDGRWQLHHREISGGLSYLFKGKEYNTAMEVVRWGRDRINELRLKEAKKQAE